VDEAKKSLDRAGGARFSLKSRWLLTCIQADGPVQALYQTLTEGFGDSSNRRPFVELANRAPYQAVLKAAMQLPPGERVRAIYGWLNSCSALGSPDPAESTCLARPAAFGPVMEHKEWKLFRVRPSNHARRRTLAAAILLNRFLEPGLAWGLGKVMEKLSPAKLIHALCAFSETGPACVGRGRGIDLAVNAVLPFMHAWDEFEFREETRSVSETLYRKFPMLADNEIIREMMAQLLPLESRSAVNGARSQRGLLHLRLC